MPHFPSSPAASLIVCMVLAVWEVAHGDFWPVSDDAPKVLSSSFFEFRQEPEQEPYLHGAVDISIPGVDTLWVRAVCTGMVVGVDEGLVVWMGLMEDPPYPPWEHPEAWRKSTDEYQGWVAIEDAPGEAWRYTHVSAARLMELLPRGRPVLGNEIQGGTYFTHAVEGPSVPLHLDLARVDASDPGECLIANPLSLLHELMGTDPYPPEVLGITLDRDDQDSVEGVFPTVEVVLPGQSEPSTVQDVYGKADIVASARDWFCMHGESGYVMGVYSLGYEVNGTEGVSTGNHTRVFDTEICLGMHDPYGDPEEGERARIFYRDGRSGFDSVEDGVFYYVASNYHNDLGEANWTAEARKSCWNTRMEQDGGLPWEAADASYPEEAEFPDGVYTVTVTASDYFNETSSSVPVIVDNWAPWLKDVVVWKDSEEGEPDVPDSTDWTILT